MSGYEERNYNKSGKLKRILLLVIIILRLAVIGLSIGMALTSETSSTGGFLLENAALTYSTCDRGLQMLSCGLNNTEITSFDAQRYVIPLNKTTCLCKDVFKVKCVGICGLLNSNIEIVSKSGSGYWKVYCPFGKKALGCHIQPGNGTKAELWREYYPLNDGSACQCYDYFGATCTATCASNIKAYSVASKHSAGQFKVGCPMGTSVLGCGIKPRNSAGPEHWRNHYGASSQECLCYDYFNATCFATCGLLQS